MSRLPDRLIDGIARNAAMQLEGKGLGHCLRLDGVSAEDADALAFSVRSSLRSDSRVAVLSAAADGEIALGVEAAIAVRNDKDTRLLLIIPPGMGHQASSLDNSFERLELLPLMEQASEELVEQLADTEVGPALRELARILGRSRSSEGWARFVAGLNPDLPGSTFGRDLWLVGLVPDLGTLHDVQQRLRRNAEVVRAVAKPSRPTASIDDRLSTAGLRRHPVRERLTRFLSGQAAVTQTQHWLREIGSAFGGELTFERWPLTDDVDTDLEELRIKPFRKPDGHVDKACKLKAAADGTLLLQVSASSSGSLVVQWTTQPPRTARVGAWRLEVVPPEDLRTPDAEPLHAMRVSGEKRRATLRIDVTEDDLDSGSLFLVRITAVDAGGAPVRLVDGAEAAAESEAFQILLVEQPPADARATSAPSIPEAVLRASVRGARSTTQGLPTWDRDGQLFGIRLDERYVARVRVSSLLASLQREAIHDPRIQAFAAQSLVGELILPENATGTELGLPAALAGHRARVMDALGTRSPRDLPEVTEWDDELRQLVGTYLGGYRRALDAADREGKLLLQRLDTLQITGHTARGEVRGLVVLPIHPLRLAWIAAHNAVLLEWAGQLVASGDPPNRRAQQVDVDLVSRVSPANLPFAVADDHDAVHIYLEELTYGSALYIPAGLDEPEQHAEALYSVLGIPRDNPQLASAAAMLERRVMSYRSTRTGLAAMRILGANPGRGQVLARALQPVVLPKESEGEEVIDVEPPRVEVIAYSADPPFAAPLPELRSLQARLTTAQTPGQHTHLAPPLGLAVRPLGRLAEDAETHHLAVLQDLSEGSPSSASSGDASRGTAFGDLLTTLQTRREDTNGIVRWRTVPALRPRGSGATADIVDTHRSHQLAAGEALGGGSVVSLVTSLSPDALAIVRAAHDRSDWVVTLDRFLGLDLYEDAVTSGLGVRRYILDFAPDFLEGMTHRLTVTTSHRVEVARLLRTAMTDLGLAAVEASVGDVLERLLVVSGRLALRLVGDTSLAREAVSLAALIAHLDRRGGLEDRIVVPVDAHPEIFGTAAREEDKSARRCDLLLIQVTSRTFRIECVEVKSRSEALLPQALADRIVDQLEDTKELLESRYFATDPPRLDGVLQRARLAGLLHYYADRAALNGLITDDKLADVHRNIDRIEDQAERAEISMRGYVVSLEGDRGYPKRHRDVPITVLTAEDLGRAGFTTVVEERSRLQEKADTSSHGRAGEQEGVDEDGQARDRERASLATADQPELPDGKSRIGDEPVSREEHEPGEPPISTPPVYPASDQRDGPAGGLRSERPRVDVVVGKDSAGQEVTWSVSTKGSPHAFIVGIPGQGKSVTTRRVIRSFAEQSLPSLVIDFHGDMATDPPAGARVVDASEGLPFSPFELADRDARGCNVAAWEISEIVAYVVGLGEMQRHSVYVGLKDAYAACSDSVGTLHRLPTMDEFAEAVEQAEQGARGRNARARIRPLTDFQLFLDDAETGFEPRDGGMVVDVSGLHLEEVQRGAAAFLLRKVYRDMFRWGQGSTMRLAVVLDEAHRLARDVTLPKLMKEGRKYGVSVVVASQGVSDFHHDVLGNAGTKIAFRTNFPDSKTVAGFMRGRDDQDLSKQIEQLGVGEAYVSTPDHSRARKVYMRR